MRNLCFILGDQLSDSISSLDGFDATCDGILMAEVADEAGYVPHHVKKLAFIFSAMRHHGAHLRERGFAIDYVHLDDAGNSGSLTGELRRAIQQHQPQAIIITEPGEWRVLEMIRSWQALFGIAITVRADDRFFATRGEFAAFAAGRKSLRMEFFYRDMRRKTGLLMQGDEPEGGQWNYDHDNRARLPASVDIPTRAQIPIDATTRAVLAMVADRFKGNFGSLDAFNLPVTRGDALACMEEFITLCLPDFGTYQDAMKHGEPFLFHALVSPALNIGLLEPRELCLAAQNAYQRGKAPLNAVEGFIRQILGWREYVRGIYWLKMPEYKATNALGAQRPLPDFFWSADTKLACIRETVENTRDNAYAHHIQRLMITGNFALLAGINPAAIEEWYLAVYADAYEWVELPNVHGMVMFADNGLLASKPYAASGAYINRMSDYCKGCFYDVTAKSGPKACPFNPLYWNFLIENKNSLEKNPRMAMPYRTLAKMTPDRRREITDDAQRFLGSLHA